MYCPHVVCTLMSAWRCRWHDSIRVIVVMMALRHVLPLWRWCHHIVTTRRWHDGKMMTTSTARMTSSARWQHGRSRHSFPHSPTLISSMLRLSIHHLALTVSHAACGHGFTFVDALCSASASRQSVSVLQPLKSGTLFLHTCTSPDTFCRHLKTHNCQLAFQYS